MMLCSQPPPHLPGPRGAGLVCPENSKLPFSAQDAFEHMNAPTVPSSHTSLGGQLGNGPAA